MFAVPIDNTGLASFVPVRRQSGSSIGQQNLGFDIFGRPIKIRDDDTDIGGTDIGQIDAGQIEQAQVLAPGLAGLIPPRRIDGGFDEESFDPPEGPQSTINVPDIDFSLPNIDDITGKVAEAIQEAKDDPLNFNPDKGYLGTAIVLGKEVDVAKTVAQELAEKGLTSLFGAKAFVATPIVDLAIQGLFGEDITSKDVGFSLGKAAAGIAFGPIGALVVAAIQGLFSFFGEDDAPDEGPAEGFGGHGLGEAPDAPPGGFADDTADAPPGSPEGPGLGEAPDAPPGGFADDTAEDPGGPSDGPDAGGDVGDDPGSACWIAGTQILMADNTYRNIEDLQIGDMVMSYPETKKTRRWNTLLEAKPIVSLLVDVHPEIWHLNNSMVSGTEWMIKGNGTAAIVQWLNVGDTVLGPDNNLVEITRVEPAEGQLKKQVIYNFETKDNYTYIADGMRTIRGRAVRGEQWGKDYLSGDKNSYEGSMQDEYNKKFNKLAA
jgi:hypothetical protein